MADIEFRRTGKTNSNGSIPGELTIAKKTWPTVERGKSYTFVRKGQYNLQMTHKTSGRTVRCLMFDHEHIRTHLIHDAKDDNHLNLSGCIAPGLSATDSGIEDSEKGMEEVWAALGGFRKGQRKTIRISNNVDNEWRKETKEQWLERRANRDK